MTIVSAAPFEVLDNELVAARGEKLLTLHRFGEHGTTVAVNDSTTDDVVVLRLGGTTPMLQSGISLMLTPDEARALAEMLCEVARFVEERGE